jgi:tRNA (cmo5U34)-methyltransferase
MIPVPAYCWGAGLGCRAPELGRYRMVPEALACRRRSSVRCVTGQWHLDAETYLAMVRAELPRYDELQDRIADVTGHLTVSTVLDLGCGTGETGRRVLERHPGASLVGVDSSRDMLSVARSVLPDATFIESRLEDPLPEGPFDVVVSAFAVHHLPSPAKADLFERVVKVLSSLGRFVLCDVVLPTAPVSSPVPLEQGVDIPDFVGDQIRWLHDAGLDASIVMADADLAILQATAS